MRRAGTVAEAAELRRRLAAVRRLHRLRMKYFALLGEMPVCAHCETVWPCETRRLLDGDDGK